MIAKLLISPQLEARVDGIEKILTKARLKKSHPDVLYFTSDSKLGIEQVRQIKGYLSLKPFQADSKAVVVEEAENLTIEAQNAILKTLEELPNNALFILSANTDSKLLPTIISRCQIIHLDPKPLLTTSYVKQYSDDLEKLLDSTIEERFEFIEIL